MGEFVFTEEDIRTGSEQTPVVRELPADLETPISIYLKLRGSGPSFLLESVTGGEQVARYSFIGVEPRKAYIFWGEKVEIQDFRRGILDKHVLEDKEDPLDILRGVINRSAFKSLPELPRFIGGLVGYLGYELVRFFEPSVQLARPTEIPDAIFLQVDTLVVFDHAFQKLVLIGIPNPEDSEGSSELVRMHLDEIEHRLKSNLPDASIPGGKQIGGMLTSNLTQEEYIQAVEAAKDQIAAGEIFQVVLSQRLSRETSAEPFEIYRALRRLNPSPYMFFFDFDNLAGGEPLRLIGASPEMHARLEGNVASVRPIAGTRRRGKTRREDDMLEQELLSDTKELAEHVMLVDLGRNDLGRICQFGTVEVKERMTVERYSHVMHIVSHVQGLIRPGSDAFDLLRATFPAGTVSGAPKIRAMQIIDELGKYPRGVYAGAVGYFSYDGGMDTCIAIRTMVMRGNRVEIAAGAGIVADSIPENEYRETLSKARALSVAIEWAESVL